MVEETMVNTYLLRGIREVNCSIIGGRTQAAISYRVRPLDRNLLRCQAF